MYKLRLSALCLTVLGLAACSVVPSADFPREQNVDLDRFMGAWYVIAHIPPSMTENAYNEIERYSRADDDTIDVRFTYREGGFDGEPQTMSPTGSVVADTGNAVWAMRFYWLLRMQYVISYVSPNYDATIIARDKRDYVWIMARRPQISEQRYHRLVSRVSDLGYDVGQLRRVPQQPLSERDDL